MKHRNKQLPTRKRRALRRVALLAALAAVLSVFRLYAFLPIQALRMVEEDHNTGPTGVIRRQLCPAPTVRDWGPQLMYLSSRDDTILLTGLDFSLLRGWREDFLTLPYDCGEGAALCGAVTVNGSSRDGHWVYGFLRIGDPTVTEVEVSLQGLTEWQQEEQTWERKEVARLRTTAEDWTEKDGYRYALVWADVREYSGDIYYGSVYFHAAAYDAAGTMAAEYDSYDAEWTGVSG